MCKIGVYAKENKINPLQKVSHHDYQPFGQCIGRVNNIHSIVLVNWNPHQAGIIEHFISLVHIPFPDTFEYMNEIIIR